jgi:hypothetical protein
MKDTFYFSHDYNARFDEKIKLLIRKHSMLGYGCYWSIVEDLYNNANALRTDYEGIAFDLRITIEQAKSIINDFDLFVIDGDLFGSASVERRLNERNEKSAKARESAFNRWNKQKENANAMRTQSDGNAIKEKKGKESKEDSPIGDVFVPSQEYIDKYKMFLDWAKKNSPKILKLKEPLTIEQFYNIRQKYSFKELEDVLLSMENYKKFSTTYSSANLTLQSWLKRSYGEGNNNSKPAQKKQGFEYPPLPSPPVDFTLGN